MSSTDDLFRPTLQDVPTLERAPAARPWRLRSQLWVAFFGGPLAITAIATLNARRLGLARERVIATAALGVAVSIAFLVAQLGWLGSALAEGGTRGGVDSAELRFAGRAAALVLYAVFLMSQRQADALYRFRLDRPEDEIFASLWIPGVVACGAAAAFSAAALWLAS